MKRWNLELIFFQNFVGKMHNKVKIKMMSIKQSNEALGIRARKKFDAPLLIIASKYNCLSYIIHLPSIVITFSKVQYSFITYFERNLKKMLSVNNVLKCLTSRYSNLNKQIKSSKNKHAETKYGGIVLRVDAYQKVFTCFVNQMHDLIVKMRGISPPIPSKHILMKLFLIFFTFKWTKG